MIGWASVQLHILFDDDANAVCVYSLIVIIQISVTSIHDGLKRLRELHVFYVVEICPLRWLCLVMACVAVVRRLVTNRHLIVQPPRGQDVEWGYCFDIHLNAFFPLLMILHFFQLPFLNSMCIV